MSAWSRPSTEEVSSLISAWSTSSGGPPDRSVVFHDLDRMEARVADLRRLFPAGALHAIAVKANPIVGVLRRLTRAGAGLEAASWEEVHLARAADCPAGWIIFDSPAKTDSELIGALAMGATVNVDNVAELERALRLRSATAAGRIGVRINPESGAGSIASTSVGGRASRFGIPVDEFVTNVLPMMRDGAPIRGLHVHVGSQGCTLGQLVHGAAVADELRRLVQDEAPADLDFVDIGGGLPTDYGGEDTAPTVAEYVHALRGRCPELMDGSVQVITEFGRAVQAGCGVAVSRVESVKVVDGRPVVVLHLGADFMLRSAYAPRDWIHRFTVFAPDGTPRDGAPDTCTIAGPLCFAGDVIGHDVPMPVPEVGDLVAIHDVGAYTISMWSRHCSRGLPPVIGHTDHGDRFEVLLPGETPSDVVRFWGGDRGEET